MKVKKKRKPRGMMEVGLNLLATVSVKLMPPVEEDWIRDYRGWAADRAERQRSAASVSLVKAVMAADAADDAAEAALLSAGWDLSSELDGYHLVRFGGRWVTCDSAPPEPCRK